jgi:protein farnesyltransferase subunit beta
MGDGACEDVHENGGEEKKRTHCFFCEACSSTPVEKECNTSYEQAKVENKVADCFNAFLSVSPRISLFSDNTIHFLKKGLSTLSGSYSSLDASRPWICYWILHALELLGSPPSDEEASHVVQFLNQCKDPVRGGYGGGPSQVAHAAPTYAAINALCTLGTDEALNSIDRLMLYKFFSSIHQSDGSYIMHEGGEVDIRGVYCAASVAKLVNIDCSVIFESSASWLASCQSYEGGFSAVPFTESHGGYTFCGFAALNLLQHEGLCDLDSLIRWLVSRQMAFEGGFSGRPNKLVDSCYSFWQVSPLILAQSLLSSRGKASSDALDALKGALFNPQALNEYVLLCCQHYGGGLKDKPGASRDFYHTCYGLSGLSVAQTYIGDGEYPDVPRLEPINPIFNICQRKVDIAHRYFGSMKPVTEQSLSVD